jgi:hypothetical protein
MYISTVRFRAFARHKSSELACIIFRATVSGVNAEMKNPDLRNSDLHNTAAPAGSAHNHHPLRLTAPLASATRFSLENSGDTTHLTSRHLGVRVLPALSCLLCRQRLFWRWTMPRGYNSVGTWLLRPGVSEGFMCRRC